MEKNSDYLFEASWEVCNKVGGIYTVVSSKVLPTKQIYGENYFLIGPYIPDKIRGVFEQQLCPENLTNVLERMKKKGITCLYGKWLIPGTPHTILIDFHSYMGEKDRIKTEMWDSFKIDSLGSDYHDYDIPVVWAYTVGMLLEEIKAELPDKKMVAQFHEWLAGTGLLYLKRKQIKIGTVFTTHATMLGRTLAAQDVNIYSLLDQIKPEEEARKNGIISKFHMERECAKNSDAFTTVSEITGLEAEKLLSKKPDVLLPNGLDMNKFQSTDEMMVKHKIYNSRINDFLGFYFFPYYQFDLTNTLIFFTAARYEYHTKGLDVLTKALGILNQKLKADKSDRTIVMFFWIPGNVRAIKQEIVQNKALYLDLKETVADNVEDIKNVITQLVLMGKEINQNSLFDEDVRLSLEEKKQRLRGTGNVPLCTHDLFNEQNDQILNGFRQAGLLNDKKDKVKVIFYPIYLSGADGLLDTSYYESMTGSHMGIFPSYYEPWGYTPFEAAALACPSITTDLAGFGKFIAPKTLDHNQGIYIINRLNRSEDDVVKDLVNDMYNYCNLDKESLSDNRMNAKDLSLLADWKILIDNYVTAHNLALANMEKNVK